MEKSTQVCRQPRPTFSLTRDLKIGQGKLYVIDDVVGKTDIESLFQLLTTFPYNLNDYDNLETQHSKHWKMELPEPLVRKTAAFQKIIKLTHSLFPKETLSLQRVHSNLLLYGDMQYPHTDIAAGITALYYANAEWKESWLGETIFYDLNRDPLYAIAPRPGRVIVFDSDIVHRSGVPSRECYAPRVSVAFKFSRKDQVSQ